MSVRIRTFRPDDYDLIMPQPTQVGEKAALPREKAVVMLSHGPAWTILDGEKVVAIGGFQVVAEGRAVAWSLAADGMTRAQKFAAMKHAARMVRQARLIGIRRIEALCAPEKMASRTFLAKLGFKNETPEGMAGYFPDGSTGELWARVG